MKKVTKKVQKTAAKTETPAVKKNKRKFEDKS